MANLLKKGSDNLLNCTILGAVTFAIIFSGDYSNISYFSWVNSLVNAVSSSVSSYMTWAGAFAKPLEGAILGAIVGYMLDRL